MLIVKKYHNNIYFVLIDDNKQIIINKYFTKQDGKLLLYKELKKTYRFENYLNIQNYEFRKSITKVRLSDHDFPIFFLIILPWWRKSACGY